MKSAAPLRIAFKPSRRLLMIEWTAHLFLASAVLVATMPVWIAASLAGVIGVSLMRVHKHLCARRGVLRLHADGRLEKLGADETPVVWQVHPSTTVLPFLVVLLYRQQGRTRSLVLVGDSCASDDFRKLRLWLRWRAAKLFTKTTGTASPEMDAARSPAREAGSPDNLG